MKIFTLFFFLLLCQGLFGQNKYRRTIRKLIDPDLFIELVDSAQNNRNTGEDIEIYENEFTRTEHNRIDSLKYSFILTRNVDMEEYSEYVNEVKDSIARMKLFYLGEEYWPKNLVLKSSTPENPKVNHQLKVDYDDVYLNGDLSDLYYPPSFSPYSILKFDLRKVNYRYTPPENHLFYSPVILKHSIWNDLPRIKPLSYLYLETTQLAVSGIERCQIQGYLQWKQSKIQYKLSQLKSDLKVRVELPTSEELRKNQLHSDSLHLKEINWNENWMISDDEYKRFINHMKDSSLREYLFTHIKNDDKANLFIQYKNKYFNRVTLEWYEFDPHNRKENRSRFPLNFNTKINLNNDEVQVLHGKWEKENRDSCFYHYYSFEYKIKGDTLNLICGQYGKNENHIKTTYNPLSHWSEKKVQLMKPSPNILRQLTYEQACAFYHWKHPIHLESNGDNWTEYILPTEEEFKSLQKGKSLDNKAKNISYPTPVFRYKISFY